MVILLVGLTIMAILLSVAMPVWNQFVKRDKEAELVFRGEQYKRAIGLYQRRSGPGTLPPSIDVLLEQRFLRKAYKDPITGKDFLLLRQGGTAVPGQPVPPAQGQAPSGGRGSDIGGQPAVAQGAGGIQGVASTSREKSIRLYNGRNYYNEWEFVFVAQVQAPGQPTPGGAGGGRGPGAAGTQAGPGRGARGGGGGNRGQPQPPGRGNQGPFPPSGQSPFPPTGRGPAGIEQSPVPPPGR
jgi:type II secretory pathway pseudopilin PulG